MVRLGRRSGAAAAILLGVLVATPASPAGAQAGGPEIEFESPRVDAPIDTSTVTVAGKATAQSLYRIKDITLTAGGETKTKTCTESPCTFSFQLTRPVNGTHQLKVAATQAALLLGTSGPSSERSRTFYVAAPAAKPVLDPPKVNEARNTELSWSRNTEPDMLFYAIFRKDPGGAKYLPVATAVAQPTSGTKVSFIDTTTSAFAGGDYSYQVVAVRKGAGGSWPAEIASEPSSIRTATVPAAPAPTSTTGVAPTPGSPAAAGPTTTVKPGTSAGVDLSGFLSTRSQPITLPPITVPEPPDTGFQGSLPFGARPPGDDIEEGEAEAVLPDDASSRSVISRISPGRPLVPVAGGLVLLLLAMHMRVLNHRIKAAPGTDLPVDDAPAPAPAPAPVRASTPAPPPQPAPAPAPALYDVDEEWAAAEEAVAGDEWAPVAEPQPEPELEPEPEPEFETVALWSPPEIDDIDIVEPDPEPEPEPFDPDAIEVFEVVSSNRRRLARSGAR